MIGRDQPDYVEREQLTEQDLAIATLVARYVERRERGDAPRANDLLAEIPAEFGPTRLDALRTVLNDSEAMRTSEDGARRRADPPPEGGTPWRACGWRGIGPPAGRAQAPKGAPPWPAASTASRSPTRSATRAARPTATASSRPPAPC